MQIILKNRGMPLTKNEIKSIRSLSQKKFRDETGLFICEGEKLVAEALASGFGIEAVYRADEIGEEAMSRISCLSSPSPALAVVRMPEGRGRIAAEEAAASILDSASGVGNGKSRNTAPLYLGLDGIRDPGNAGTIIRIADWFGINAVFASEGSVDIFNPKVVQATMGAIFRVRFAYTDLASLCGILGKNGIPVFGTFLDGEDIYKADLMSDGPEMIVMGSESDGISRQTASNIGRRLFIPPFGNCGGESLNVAAATAITCSEFRRRY